MRNEIIGFEWFILGVIFLIWTIAAGIRAYKAVGSLTWPVAGAWIVTFFSGSLALVFFDVFRIRITNIPSDSSLWVIIARGIPVIFGLWAFWRWAQGNILGPRDNFK